MFQPGISGNTRGRPKGTCGGRAQVLATLDRTPPSDPPQPVSPTSPSSLASALCPLPIAPLSSLSPSIPLATPKSAILNLKSPSSLSLLPASLSLVICCY